MLVEWLCYLSVVFFLPTDAPPASNPATADRAPVAAAAAQPEEADPAAAQPTTEPAAEESPEPAAAAPAAPEASWSDKVTFGGLVDTYFSVPFQGDLRDPSLLRVFDAGNGSFLFSYAELAASMAPDPGGFRLDLGFGPVADLTSLEVSGDPPVVGASEVFKHVQQAYASFKHGVFTADIGKFVTNAGAEVIEAKDNWNYSRSFLFGFAIPFSHTGIRLTAALSDQISIQGSVVNGWDVVVDNNDNKTFGGSIFFTNAPTNTTAILNSYVGKEADDVRFVIDAVLIQKIGDKLAVNLNGDYAEEGDLSWWGVAAMARVAASNGLSVALRAEHFQDPDGARTTIVDNQLTEVTATIGVSGGGHAEVRLEGRVDLADQEIFGPSDDTTKVQGTVQLAGLAWF